MLLYFAPPFADIAAETVVLAFIFSFEDGLFTGLSLSLLMALVSIICFRDMRRPTLYRFAMVVLPLVVMVARRGAYLASFQTALSNPDVLHAWAFVNTVLLLALQVFICHISAGRYLPHVLCLEAKRKVAPLSPN